MQRPWLASYPAGVPASVETGNYESLISIFEESFSKFRDRDANACMGKRQTYGDIDRRSRALGAWLQGRGLKRGDRVAIMMPNLLQYPVTVAAVLRAGFIAVNVNPLYTPRELAHQLKDSGAKAIIILENFANTLEEVIEETEIKHVVIAKVGDLLGLAKGTIANYVVGRSTPRYSLPGAVRFKVALWEGKKLNLTKPDIKKDDVAVLQYTGGTTGLSKGATLTHGNILSAVLASDAWLQPALKSKKITGQMNFVCALPLYHVFAFISCALLATRIGGLNILIPNPRDLKGVVRDLAKYRIHIFPAVNTLFNGLANYSAFAKLDFSQLVVCNGGGTAVQEAVAKKWLAITGCPIVEGYGLSETCSGVTCNPTNSDRFTGTIGLPLPGVDIRILDDDGKDVALGEAGEIAIKGPMVMTGYWQRPDETANVMTSDGFFKSGDIGIMDPQGYTKIVDRKKDMILVSGFNVYPNEVEAVVANHDGVVECAAIGVPDARTGEAVMLFVVPRDGSVRVGDLMTFCKTQLAGYKVPRTIELRDALPKTNVGKILRRELRDEIMKAKDSQLKAS